MARLDPKLGYRIEHKEFPSTYSDPDSSEGSIGERIGFHSRTLSVYAHAPSGERVGEAHIFLDHPKVRNSMICGYVNVHPDHQRKGIASAMYAHAEKMTRKKLVPSKAQWSDGENLWAGNAKNPQFGKSEPRPSGQSGPVGAAGGKLEKMATKAPLPAPANVEAYIQGGTAHFDHSAPEPERPVYSRHGAPIGSTREIVRDVPLSNLYAAHYSINPLNPATLDSLRASNPTNFPPIDADIAEAREYGGWDKLNDQPLDPMHPKLYVTDGMHRVFVANEKRASSVKVKVREKPCTRGHWGDLDK